MTIWEYEKLFVPKLIYQYNYIKQKREQIRGYYWNGYYKKTIEKPHKNPGSQT